MFFLVVASAAVLTWLYFWLLGHWFARVVGFLAYAAILACVGSYSGVQLAQLTAVDTLSGDGRYHGANVEHHCPPNLPVALCAPAPVPNEPESPDDFLARTGGTVPLHIIKVVPAGYLEAFPAIGAVLGVVSAWFVSGIPLYYWRRRFANQAG